MSEQPEQPAKIEELNEELLEAAAPEAPKEEPKKNTKQALLNKILEVSERSGIPLEHSNSKLKRMNKQQLAEVLAEVIEKGMQRRIAARVGVSEDADQRTIGIAALRMVHDTLAMGLETGGNHVLEPKGYKIHNFSAALKEPTTSAVIDGCLAEIADESPELLEYIQSPWSRLGIAWCGALAFSIRKTNKEHVTVLERRPFGPKNPGMRSSHRRPPPRKVHFDSPPAKKTVKEV